MTASLLRRFTIQSPELAKCYELGYDCAVNGANTTNCHFSIFSSPDRTKAWEDGKKVGEQEGEIR